jgi:DNA repair protein RadC
MFTEPERALIKEAISLLRRGLNENDVISSYHVLEDYCRLRVRGEVEVLHLLLLDNKNRLIQDARIATGTVANVMFYPREIARMALRRNASAVIIAHNHPSGDPEPSEQDVRITRDAHAACAAVGVTFHDHVIVTPTQVVSLRARSMI